VFTQNRQFVPEMVLQADRTKNGTFHLFLNRQNFFVEKMENPFGTQIKTPNFVALSRLKRFLTENKFFGFPISKCAIGYD
jgi:hypothetical protein